VSPIGSVYGNYQGVHDWRDGLDNNAPALKGATNDVPGIALPDRATLGHWYYVLAPNGQAQILQQTDIGPAARTKRGIDVNAAAAEKFGYSPNDFPTDRPFRVALLTDRRPDCLLS